MLLTSGAGDAGSLKTMDHLKPATSVRAVLFDADGVVQYVPGGFTVRLAAAHGLVGNHRDAFESALFALEADAAQGRFAFMPAVADLVARYQPTIDVERLFDVWRYVETYPGVRELINQLRASGIRCGLATNQQDLRARHMSSALGYADLFDLECYSCQMGVRKPNAAFFTAAVAAVACAPTEIVFIDDSAVNVDAARACGLVGVLHDPASGAAGIAAALATHGIDVHATNAGR